MGTSKWDDDIIITQTAFCQWICMWSLIIEEKNKWELKTIHESGP